MHNHVRKARFPLMALAIVALLTALWGGLARLGWAIPLPFPTLIIAHGPLMVCGFLGTLIGIERAVALGYAWTYTTPLLTALGVIALLVNLPAPVCMTLASAGLVAVFGVIGHRQLGLATLTMTLGAVLWLFGNALWLTGRPLVQVVPWWEGFLLLTIAGERLELSRLLRLSMAQRLMFLVAMALLLVGLVVTSTHLDMGVRLTGVGHIALAWWLLRYDIARRTVQQTGLTRFIAACLLAGYVWLGVGGALHWRFGGVFAGPHYDAMLHTVFVGFVFSMIFGHAPIVLPAVLGRSLAYHPLFYLAPLLLHASLVLRMAGDLLGWSSGRQWGGLLNAVAVLLFFGTLAVLGLASGMRIEPQDTAE
jgi:hypothetical protein